MKKATFSTSILFALVLVGCTKSSNDEGVESQVKPSAAEAPAGLPAATLERLKADLEWLKAEDRALIIERPDTTSFVQFLGATLKVDVPTAGMSAEEKSRAEKVMKRLDVPAETVQLYAAGGAKAGTLLNYRKDLAGDVTRALDVVEAVFLEVFEMPPNSKLEGKRVR
jgi:hypothetical protein